MAEEPATREPELTPWMQRRLEQAYQQRARLEGRDRTSRQDFRAGYLSALIDVRSRSSFVHPEEVGL